MNVAKSLYFNLVAGTICFSLGCAHYSNSSSAHVSIDSIANPKIKESISIKSLLVSSPGGVISIQNDLESSIQESILSAFPELKVGMTKSLHLGRLKAEDRIKLASENGYQTVLIIAIGSGENKNLGYETTGTVSQNIVGGYTYSGNTRARPAFVISHESQLIDVQSKQILWTSQGTAIATKVKTIESIYRDVGRAISAKLATAGYFEKKDKLVNQGN